MQKDIFSRQYNYIADSNINAINRSIGKCILISIPYIYLIYYFNSIGQKEASVLCAAVLICNIILLGFDFSKIIQTGKLGELGADFSRVKIPFRVYLGNFKNKSHSGGAHGETPESQLSLALIHNPIIDHLTAVSGFILKGIAMHIKPNFDDFLRRLSEMEILCPLTIQSQHSKNDGGIEQSYEIIVHRAIHEISKRTMAEMLIKFQTAIFEVKNNILANFPHFKFDLISEPELIASLRSVFSVSSTKPEDHTAFEAPKQLPLLNFSVLGLNIVICIATILIIDTPLEILIALGILVFLMIHTVKRIFMLNFFYIYDVTTAKEIDLFPDGFFLQSKISKSLYFYSRYDESITAIVPFMFSKINRYFNFNQVKMYRQLINLLQESLSGASIRYNFQRLSLGELNNYKSVFIPEFWDNFFESDQQMTTVRKMSGLYSVQPSFIFTLRKSASLASLTVQKLAGLEQQATIAAKAFLNTNFPNCTIFQAPAVIFPAFFAHSRDYWKYRTSLPRFILSGAEENRVCISKLIEIPEEIHRNLPTFYPAEFSAPLLSDEIEFGQTFNTEHLKAETPSGLSISEIPHNILVFGESYSEFHKSAIVMMKELICHDIPCVIFDSDGSWKPLLGLLEFHQKLNSIKILQPHINFPLNLFNVFTSASNSNDYGNLSSDLVEHTSKMLAQIYGWRENDINLLMSVWTKNLSQKMDIETIQCEIKGLATDKQEFSLHQAGAYAAMLHLSQEKFKNIFDGHLNPEILETNLASNHTLLVDLTLLPQKERVLYISLFLLKLYYYFMVKNGTSKIPERIVHIPDVDAITPRSKEGPSNLFSVCSYLNKHGISFFAESQNPLAIDPNILSLIQSYFVFRTSGKPLGLAARVLKIDSTYTNIASQAHRKMSYQINYLSSMQSDQCLVARAHIKLPYVLKITAARELDDIYIKAFHTINYSSLVGESDLSPLIVQHSENLLESDFAGDKPLIPYLQEYFALQLAKYQNMKFIPKQQLRSELFVLLQNYYSSKSFSPERRQRDTDRILDLLITKQYFQRTSKPLSSGIDSEDYVPVKKMFMVMNELKIKHNSSKLSRSSNNRIIFGENIVDVYNTEHQSESNQSNNSSTAPQNSPDSPPESSESGLGDQSDDLSDEDKTWINVLKKEFPLIVVHGKSLYRTATEEEHFQEIFEYLQSALSALIASIKSNGAAEYIAEIHDLCQKIDVIKESPPSNIGSQCNILLIDLENYAITL
jgi:hypothetical protein